MKKILEVLKSPIGAALAMLLVLGGYGVIHAGPEVVMSVVNWASATTDANVFKQQINSNGQLEFYENANLNAPVLQIDDNSGSLAPVSRTSAQLTLLTPPRAGAMVFNSTIVGICQSSGTGQGAWVISAASTTRCIS